MPSSSQLSPVQRCTDAEERRDGASPHACIGSCAAGSTLEVLPSPYSRKSSFRSDNRLPGPQVVRDDTYELATHSPQMDELTHLAALHATLSQGGTGSQFESPRTTTLTAVNSSQTLHTPAAAPLAGGEGSTASSSLKSCVVPQPHSSPESACKPPHADHPNAGTSAAAGTAATPLLVLAGDVALAGPLAPPSSASGDSTRPSSSSAAGAPISATSTSTTSPTVGGGGGGCSTASSPAPRVSPATLSTLPRPSSAVVLAGACSKPLRTRYATRRSRRPAPPIDVAQFTATPLLDRSQPMSLAATPSFPSSPLHNAAGEVMPTVPNLNYALDDLPRSQTYALVGESGPGGMPGMLPATQLGTSARSNSSFVSARSARLSHRGVGAGPPPSLREMFPDAPDSLFIARERLYVPRTSDKRLGRGAYGEVMQSELYPPGVDAPVRAESPVESFFRSSAMSTPRLGTPSAPGFTAALAFGAGPGGISTQDTNSSDANQTNFALPSPQGSAGTNTATSAERVPLHMLPYGERTADFYNGGVYSGTDGVGDSAQASALLLSGPQSWLQSPNRHSRSLSAQLPPLPTMPHQASWEADGSTPTPASVAARQKKDAEEHELSVEVETRVASGESLHSPQTPEAAVNTHSLDAHSLTIAPRPGGGPAHDVTDATSHTCSPFSPFLLRPRLSGDELLDDNDADLTDEDDVLPLGMDSTSLRYHSPWRGGKSVGTPSTAAASPMAALPRVSGSGKAGGATWPLRVDTTHSVTQCPDDSSLSSLAGSAANSFSESTATAPRMVSGEPTGDATCATDESPPPSRRVSDEADLDVAASSAPSVDSHDRTLTKSTSSGFPSRRSTQTHEDLSHSEMPIGVGPRSAGGRASRRQTQPPEASTLVTPPRVHVPPAEALTPLTESSPTPRGQTTAADGCPPGRLARDGTPRTLGGERHQDTPESLLSSSHHDEEAGEAGPTDDLTPVKGEPREGSLPAPRGDGTAKSGLDSNLKDLSATGHGQLSGLRDSGSAVPSAVSKDLANTRSSVSDLANTHTIFGFGWATSGLPVIQAGTAEPGESSLPTDGEGSNSCCAHSCLEAAGHTGSTFLQDRAVSYITEAVAAGAIPFRSVAVKTFSKANLSNRKVFQSFHNELNVASRLSHTCLMNVYGIAEDQDSVFLVMDLAENGNLARYIKDYGVEDTREMAPRFVADIVLLLEYLRDGSKHPYRPPLSARRAETLHSTESDALPSSTTTSNPALYGDEQGTTPLTAMSAVHEVSAHRRQRSRDASSYAAGAATNPMSGDDANSNSNRSPSTFGIDEENCSDGSGERTRESSAVRSGRGPHRAAVPLSATWLRSGDAEGTEVAGGTSELDCDSIVVHGDLKPENMLLTWDYHIKVSDFGNTCFLGDEEANRFGGTPAYIAPEMLLETKSGPYTDLWSLGCVLYELLEGTPLFSGKTQYLITSQIKKFVAGTYHISFLDEDAVSADAKDLVQRLLRVNPLERIGAVEQGGFAQLKRHPFFHAIDWGCVLETSNITPTNTDYTKEFMDFLHDGETVVYCSPVELLKDSAVAIAALHVPDGVLVMHGSCPKVLVLTDTPRFFLVDPESDEIAFTIPWSRELRVRAERSELFTVCAPPIGQLHFRDRNRRADLWGAKANALAGRISTSAGLPVLSRTGSIDGAFAASHPRSRSQLNLNLSLSGLSRDPSTTGSYRSHNGLLSHLRMTPRSARPPSRFPHGGAGAAAAAAEFPARPLTSRVAASGTPPVPPTPTITVTVATTNSADARLTTPVALACPHTRGTESTAAVAAVAPAQATPSSLPLLDTPFSTSSFGGSGSGTQMDGTFSEDGSTPQSPNLTPTGPVKPQPAAAPSSQDTNGVSQVGSTSGQEPPFEWPSDTSDSVTPPPPLAPSSAPASGTAGVAHPTGRPSIAQQLFQRRQKRNSVSQRHLDPTQQSLEREK